MRLNHRGCPNLGTGPFRARLGRLHGCGPAYPAFRHAIAATRTATTSSRLRPRMKAGLCRLRTTAPPVARGAGPICDWRETWLAVTLAVHELEGMLIRKQLP